MNEGEISTADIRKLDDLLKENPNTTNWNEIRRILITYQPNKAGVRDIENYVRKALNRACHGRSGRSILKLILKKLKNLSMLCLLAWPPAARIWKL